jgi:hypothetical protein
MDDETINSKFKEIGHRSYKLSFDTPPIYDNYDLCGKFGHEDDLVTESCYEPYLEKYSKLSFSLRERFIFQQQIVEMKQTLNPSIHIHDRGNNE